MGAGRVGGLGLASAAFEPTHGFAARYTAQYKLKPR